MTPVIVGGVVANKHLSGGAVWTRLNWILGLRKLGFDVHFIEQIGRDACVDATGAVVPFELSENLKCFQAVCLEFGFGDRATLVYEGGEEVAGLSHVEIAELAADAAFLINISGHLTLKSVLRSARCRVYVDLDPGFTQFWHAAGTHGARLANHDYYYTVGENIGSPECSIPTSGVSWRPIRQPVVLEQWPFSTEGDPRRFTTIASWRGPFGPIEHRGTRYGLKVHEFRKYVAVPDHVPATFEIALDIHEADVADRLSLERHGWRLTDPRRAVADPASFRQYVQTSGAEFSVAQGIYVETNSGWFSDRTVRYLASGKPALVQDTGFSRRYPVGEGLVAFRTLKEADDGARRILGEYSAHCEASRRLAEDHFDSDKVLGRLVDEVGAP